MTRHPNGPESTVTLGDDDLVLLDEHEDLAATNPTMPRSPFASASQTPAPAAAEPLVKTVAFDSSSAYEPPPAFDRAKTLKIQMHPASLPQQSDPLARTVVMNEPTTVMLEASSLDLPSRAVTPFRPNPVGMQPHSPRSLSASRPGEFTGTVTLSIADVMQAEAQPALPFAQKSAQTPVPAPSPVASSISSDLPDAFRAHLSSIQSAPAPMTIGQSVMAGALQSSPITSFSDAAIPAVAPVIAPQIAPAAPADALVLLYLHRPSMQRIVRKPVWQPILDALEDEPIDPEADDPALSPDPSEIQDQTQAYAILKRGRYIDRTSALAVLDAAANKAGRFAPPLELFEGELEPALDPVESLRALVSIMPSFASRDERLQAAIASASAFLNTPGATYAPPIVRRHDAEVRQAYAAGKPSTPIDEIDTLVVRALLEKRFYHKQQVLGGEHIRASLFSFGQPDPLVVYIPAEAALMLPLDTRFRARILAEIHFPQDAQQSSPMALRSLAFASVVRRGFR